MNKQLTHKVMSALIKDAQDQSHQMSYTKPTHIRIYANNGKKMNQHHPKSKGEHQLSKLNDVHNKNDFHVVHTNNTMMSDQV